jgi:tRNA modification GTPase
MSHDNRTIFAPATLVGDAGITVIRITGSNTLQLALGFYSQKPDIFTPLDSHKLQPNTLHHGYLFDNNEFIDEVVISVFIAPNSFTGEDVVELSTHGGSFIFRKVNDLLLRLGARHAEAGEFSKRAYLNGKMDLAQAEAVADLIKAKTESANKLALRQLTGEYSEKIKSLKEELINYCSLLELELDFSDEGLDLVSRETLFDRLNGIINNIQRFTNTYKSGKIIKNGINMAIIGRPNVGKSSIFNYFLNENRAIVTDIPGTTRDYLQEPLVMDGIQFNLIDTAGIRDTQDVIEQEGVRRSKMKIDESDIILEVEDISQGPLSSNGFAQGVYGGKVIKVYNKSDIGNGKITENALKVSAKTGENMTMLHEEITRKARALIGLDINSDIIITNERHRDCLLKSCEYLVNAKNLINQGGGNELISFEIRSAMDAVTDIIGKTTNVDILNNIFTKFCIGK